MSNVFSALNESYPAIPSSVPIARRALSAFAAAAGASEEQVEDVRLAASEALTNAVVHAYRDDSGMISVTAAVVEDELWMLISDDGCGLGARADRPGLGLGLALIAQITDDLMIVPRSSGGTEVRMRFNLASPQPVAEDHERASDGQLQGSDGRVRGSFASAARPASSRF